MEFTGFTQDTFDFFFALSVNNTRAFFEANRERYMKSVKEPFYALCNSLSPFMESIDPVLETRPQRAVSRIYRDARRVKDGLFYRDHLWIAFKPRGEQEQGFTFWLEMGSFTFEYGLGAYNPSPALLQGLRAHIIKEPETVEKALQKAVAAGFLLGGEEYKRLAPPPLPPLATSLYAKKNFYHYKSEPVSPAHCTGALADRLKKDFAALVPLYDFYREQDVRWSL